MARRKESGQPATKGKKPDCAATYWTNSRRIMGSRSAVTAPVIIGPPIGRLVPLGAVRQRVDRIACPAWPMMIVIHSPWRFWKVHEVAVKGPCVHDPQWLGAAPLGQCDNRDWQVAAIVQASAG